MSSAVKASARARTQENIRRAVQLIALAFIVMLLMVWEHVEAVRLKQKVGMMRREVDRLTYENGRMRMHVHQWESPSHLQAVARDTYKMASPDPKQVIAL